MKRLYLLLGLLLCGATAAWAQTSGGAITAAHPDLGTWVMSIPTGSEVQPRDVYQVFHRGVLMGECMVLSVKKTGAVVVPTASFRGAPHVGDRTAFARHADAPDQGPKWYDFKGPDGTFEVSLPAPPAGPETKQETEDGMPVKSMMWQLTDQAHLQIYLVGEGMADEALLSHSVTLGNDEFQIEYEIKNVESQGWKIYWSQPMKVAGYPAREIECDKGPVVARARIVSVNDHRYLLMVASPKKVGISSDSYRFLNSLKLTAKANP